MTKTLRLLRDAASEWNRKHSALARAMLPETWAACFAFLSVGECIKVSHVSRSWRSIACGFPRLWRHIELPSPLCSSIPDDAPTELWSAPRARDAPSGANVLAMVLARSGQCLVDIIVVPGRYSQTLEAAGYIPRDDIHRVRSVSWPLPPTHGMFAQPAPFLEEIVCADHSPIPADLLGGVQGILRRMDVRNLCLPSAPCTALRTVTHLTARLRDYHQQPPIERESLKRLFDLMPRLESLSLSGISEHFHGYLPPGPAPLTLAHLALDSGASPSDLARYVAVWRTDGLKTVVLRAYLLYFDKFELAVLFQDATSLTIGPISQQRLRFAISTSTGLTCTLRLSHDYMTTSRIAASATRVLRKAHPALAQLREIAAPIAILNAFLSGRPTLALQCVRATMHKTKDTPDEGTAPRSRYFECDHLAFLSSFPGPLARLVVRVESHLRLFPDDARRLVAAVAAHGNRCGCEITMEGFKSDVVHGLDVGDTRISFVTD